MPKVLQAYETGRFARTPWCGPATCKTNRHPRFAVASTPAGSVTVAPRAAP